MPRDWLGGRRTEVAAERILDAAGELFAHGAVATVGMNDIASAAGCSRATLYRYFESRHALHLAYVQRESLRLFGEIKHHVAAIPDPRERLLEGMIAAVGSVRQSPALAAWFATTQRPIGVEMAEESEVIKAMTEAFVVSLGLDNSDDVERRARWLVRIMTSLMLFPGRDEGDERSMLETFVIPGVLPGSSAIR
jgi:AcrR family transcriptional regulator